MVLSSELTPEPLRAWWWQTRTAPRSTTSPPTFSKWHKLSLNVQILHIVALGELTFFQHLYDRAEMMCNWWVAVYLCCCPAVVGQEQPQTQRWPLRSSPLTWSCTPSPQAGCHVWPLLTACSNKCSLGMSLKLDLYIPWERWFSAKHKKLLMDKINIWQIKVRNHVE